MDKHFTNYITLATKASSCTKTEDIQTLWSGYGTISRYQLFGGNIQSVVVKHVKLPESVKHPRGWNTNLSHKRKLKSYDVETEWYSNFSDLCDHSCRIPKCFGIHKTDNELIIVMEDLDAAGYPLRKQSISMDEIKRCLQWLANFHATFLNTDPSKLWSIGTYWHLDTRPDELEELSDKALKQAAKQIDQELNNCTYKTLVHGDAKLANFCFSEDGTKVSAVDFQYIGGGCGMKDVAYFIGSCLYEEDCERYNSELLDYYFKCLKLSIEQKQPNTNYILLEKEWRRMFPIAWADFHRFIKGWSPGHWKINSYSERLSKQVVQLLKHN